MTHPAITRALAHHADCYAAWERNRLKDPNDMNPRSIRRALRAENARLRAALAGAVKALDERCTITGSFGYVECVVCCVQWYEAAHRIGHTQECPIRIAKETLAPLPTLALDASDNGQTP